MSTTTEVHDAPQIQASATWSAGLDVGGTKIHGVLLDPQGRTRATIRVPSRRGQEAVLQSIVQAVGSLAEAAKIASKDVSVLGIGIPGVVDRQVGTVRNAVNLGIGDQLLDLSGELGASLGLRVTVENDLNVAAIGAKNLLYPHLSSLGFLALGTGVAASLVLGTKLLAGARGAAGEIGHLPYQPDGPACGCGQMGCLELYISGTALDRKWPSGDIQVPSPVALFSAAADGDVHATEIRDEFLDALAHGIETMFLSWDPERIILGGGVAGVGAPLLNALKERLDAKALPSAFLSSLEMSNRIELVPPHIHVAALGAALVARGE